MSASNAWNNYVKESAIVVFFYFGVASAGAGLSVSSVLPSSAAGSAFAPAGCESPAAALELYSFAGCVPPDVDASLLMQKEVC